MPLGHSQPQLHHEPVPNISYFVVAIELANCISCLYLQGVQDGEYICKEACAFVETEEPENPRQTEEREQDNSAFHELPVVHNTYLSRNNNFLDQNLQL